jgi:HEPN domain-containing protein
MACFHAQQAAEKALKGFLVYTKTSSPRIHNLPELLDECSAIDNSFSLFLSKAITLNQFYAPTRYPDALAGLSPSGMPNKAIVEESLVYAKEIFTFCLDAVRQIDKKRLDRSNDR